MYVYSFVCRQACMYVYVCVFVYICIHTYITSNRPYYILPNIKIDNNDNAR